MNTIGGLSLRPATRADAAFLFHVLKTTMGVYVDEIWGWDDAEQKARFWDDFNTETDRIIVLAGTDIGVLGIEESEYEVTPSGAIPGETSPDKVSPREVLPDKAQPDNALPDKAPPAEVFLDKIYILPDYQRRGIGTYLINDLLRRAFAAGRPVRLRVLKNNPARRLYERLGFVQIDETETSYVLQASPARAPHDDEP